MADHRESRAIGLASRVAVTVRVLDFDQDAPGGTGQNGIMLAGARDSPDSGGRAPIAVADPCEAAAVQERLVGALQRATGATLLETHISFVLLTGTVAYKIKKCVNLGFLDFRTLSARRSFCEEELRLNRRLAPEIYLDVVPVTGTPDDPRLAGDGPPLEYAVRMREFPQEALATHALDRGELTTRHIDALAAQIAAFHLGADAAPANGTLGASATVLRLALENFAQLRPLLRTAADLRDLDLLETWTQQHHAACAEAFARRHRQGFIRECHGDLHLGNIAIVERNPLVFDCIEFNEEMRWIDVMNEIAFTTMDLEHRGRPDLAFRFLNAYLEITGDYDGLCVLRFYVAYRALVRAKVALLRAAQLAPGETSNALRAEYASYLQRAKACARSPRPALVITHGYAGSGKTTYSQQLLEHAGAVRLRSDVERKRLSGLLPGDRRPVGIEAGLYGPVATRTTYRHLLAQARKGTAAGYLTIVDAAFLMRGQRRLFAELGEELGIPFLIVSFTAREDVLRERIVHRLREANDASDADLEVLAHQLRTQEPLTAGEQSVTVVLDTETALDTLQSQERWKEILDRLADPRAGAEAPE